MQALTVRANAKINLALAVTGKRNDGYHNIDTVMQTVSLYDTLTVEKSKGISVICGELSGEKNIAYRAAQVFFNETGVAAGCRIIIEKNIPSTAGLGGGSSDAAAVICALDRLYKTRLSYASLCKIAVKTGADVPFLIRGGTMRAEGKGEILTPLTPLENIFFVIVKSGEKPSTAEMYSRLDKISFSVPDIEKTVEAVNKNDIPAVLKSIGNSFSVLWNSEQLEKRLKILGAAAVSLSGSGPAVFAVFTNEDAAKSAAKILSKEKYDCRFTRLTNFSLKFE